MVRERDRPRLWRAAFAVIGWSALVLQYVLMIGPADGWVVLRCVNRRDIAVAGAWRTAREVVEASLARLDETRLEPLVVSDRVIEFDAPPKAIVTVLARWADGD